MKLRDYAIQNGLTMQKLADLTKVSKSQLYYLDRFDNPEIKMDTMVKIYHGTKRKFGKGLQPNTYLKGFDREVFAIVD